VGLLTISASLTAHKKEGYLLPKLCLHCNRNFILRYLRETMTLALVIRRSLLLRTKWARPRNAATTEKEPSPSASPTQYTHTSAHFVLTRQKGRGDNRNGVPQTQAEVRSTNCAKIERDPYQTNSLRTILALGAVLPGKGRDQIEERLPGGQG